MTDPTRGTKVFVIHGRNEQIRRDFFAFLRAIGLDPFEWSEAVKLTGKAAPFIGDVLDAAFIEAGAAVVLLTPDDEVRLGAELVKPGEGEDERAFQRQARPNVLFEAGMAFGRHPERTLLVSIGRSKNFSDVAGRHVIRLTNDAAQRMEVVNRLQSAGCSVQVAARSDWLTTGHFEIDAPSVPPPVSKPDVTSGTGLQPNEEAVLKFLTHGMRVQVPHVAATLNISQLAAKHWLDTLEEKEMVYAGHGVGAPTTYELAEKGRAYAVSKGWV